MSEIFFSMSEFTWQWIAHEDVTLQFQKTYYSIVKATQKRFENDGQLIKKYFRKFFFKFSKANNYLKFLKIKKWFSEILVTLVCLLCIFVLDFNAFFSHREMSVIVLYTEVYVRSISDTNCSLFLCKMHVGLFSYIKGAVRHVLAKNHNSNTHE